MIVKRLRQEKHWSQDQLSTLSGLSLRTIQRIESGSKASLESMKSLAAVFEVDISTLEREIMVIDKDSSRWKKNPLWLRALFWGSNRVWLSRRKDALMFELFILLVAVLMSTAGLLQPDESKKFPLVFCGLIAAFSAYIWAVLVRLSDRYSIWQTGT
jgi:transcriptional regulator with XRE-family HTH domain